MRKIDKNQILSTKYVEWAKNELSIPESVRKEYDNDSASSFKYYLDVVMNLLYCQNGLCAYTEEQLCPEKYFDKKNWAEGRFKPKNEDNQRINKGDFVKNKPYNGELDHFDPTLKKTQGWDWDNFFMIDADTNNRKGKECIDYRLKLDRDDYDPFEIFDYSLDTHRFIINTEYSISETEREQLQEIVDDVLGINFPNLVDKRNKRLTARLKMIEFGVPMKPEEHNEFPTAFQFCLQILQILDNQ